MIIIFAVLFIAINLWRLYCLNAYGFYTDVNYVNMHGILDYEVSEININNTYFDIQFDRRIRYYNVSNKTLGHIIYKRVNGQIGFIYVNEEHRRKGVATSMLKEIEKEFKNIGLPSIWCVCSENHFFWSKVNYTYYEKVHESVTGSGYKKLLNSDYTLVMQ